VENVTLGKGEFHDVEAEGEGDHGGCSALISTNTPLIGDASRVRIIERIMRGRDGREERRGDCSSRESLLSLV